MSLVAEQVPIDRRKGTALVAVDLELLGALDGARIVGAGLAHAREVSLHVGHEHRHAVGREAFGDRLQGHGLAGAGCAGDQAVPVGIFQEEKLVGVARSHEDRGIVAHAVSFARTIDFSQRCGAIVDCRS